jgi:SagB-type dehydrogenase family enzyme
MPQRFLSLICLLLLLFPAVLPAGSSSSPSPQDRVIELPGPSLSGLTVEQAIQARRSIRRYSDRPLSLEQLSQLAFAAQGITDRSGSRPLRAAPSAGALYPIELYIAVHRVADVPPGLYHYRPESHVLETVRPGDLQADLTTGCLGQSFVGKANAVFIMTAVFDRTTRRYGSRGERYVHMEAGHISQNLYLQAVSLGLGSVAVGAFRDEDLDRLLDLGSSPETCLYLHAVGVPEMTE